MTQEEHAQEAIRKATMLILAAIAEDLHKAGLTFGQLIHKLHKGDTEQLSAIQQNANALAHKIVDLAQREKATRMEIILACVCTAEQTTFIVGENILEDTLMPKAQVETKQ